MPHSIHTRIADSLDLVNRVIVGLRYASGARVCAGYLRVEIERGLKDRTGLQAQGVPLAVNNRRYVALPLHFPRISWKT